MPVAKAAIAQLTRVRDIMSNQVIALETHATVGHAARVLSEHKIGGAPVLKDGRVRGIVSKSDLVDPRNDLEVLVEKVMTRVIYAVRADDPALLAVHLMVDESIHRVLVVDEEGAIVGIIAPIDVLRAVRNGLQLGLTDGGGNLALEYVDLRTHA